MTNGIKEEKDKLYYELDWEFVEGMAKRMSGNKEKYPPWNWKNNIEVDKLNQALIRHLVEIQKGNLSDEQEYGHYYALACNSMMIIHQLNKEKL